MALTYAPALKAKMGELTALEALADNVKDQIAPILEVPGIDWNYSKDRPAKTLQKHLEDVVAAIEKNWPARNFFIDFSPAAQVAAADNKTDILTVFDSIAQQKTLTYIPVVDFDRSTLATYLETSQAIHGRTNSGVCLRIKYADLEDVVEELAFTEFLKTLELPMSDIDLVLDFGSISSYESDKTLYLATRLVLQSIPDLTSWRNVIVLASSFPHTLRGMDKNSRVKIPRREWKSWLRLKEKSDRIGRLPIFGDYSIAHPELVEVDPRIMNMSAAIRYSTPDDWLILKGESVKIKGFTQFPELSAELVSMPEYAGADFSAGDRDISGYADGTTNGTGNATTWRKIGNNHHLTLVVTQIANPPVTSE